MDGPDLATLIGVAPHLVPVRLGYFASAISRRRRQINAVSQKPFAAEPLAAKVRGPYESAT
jgi:hypothetical protein